jgi:hypothetical protein
LQIGRKKEGCHAEARGAQRERREREVEGVVFNRLEAAMVCDELYAMAIDAHVV